MSRRADELTAEYLMRQVPSDWQAHEDTADMARDEYVSPIRFIVGWVVVVAIAALIFWGL